MLKKPKSSTAPSTASPQSAAAFPQTLLSNAEANLRAELRAYRSALEKQERCRIALADATKRVKAQWDVVERAFAITEAQADDPPPAEVSHG